MDEAAKNRWRLVALLLMIIPPIGLYFAIGAGATWLVFVGIVLIAVGMFVSMLGA